MCLFDNNRKKMPNNLKKHKQKHLPFSNQYVKLKNGGKLGASMVSG